MTGGGSAVEIATEDPGNLCQCHFLDSWVSRLTTALSHRLGYGVPLSRALSKRSVLPAIADTNTANLEYDWAKSQVTFTNCFGDALAQCLQVWTSVLANDADLPEIHRILLKTPRGSQYGALNALLQERAAASPLSIAHMNAPIVTTKIVQPAPTGLDFRQGLSPFAIVCQGHSGVFSNTM